MSGFLFHSIIFGPVHSRRLGVSLGINLLPAEFKYCTFNCIYCECGWTHSESSFSKKLPSAEIVKQKLEVKLKRLTSSNQRIDAFTFAGNGEPTLHPEFPEIIDITTALRDQYFPEAKVTLLSNASLLHKETVFKALKKIDKNILKLDAGTNETFKIINQPKGKVSIDDVVYNLKKFNGNLIIQTLFLEGEINNQHVSNITNEEIDAWIVHIKEIKPQYVMIYPFARKTPIQSLRKISFTELNNIAEKVEKAGYKTYVYG